SPPEPAGDAPPPTPAGAPPARRPGSPPRRRSPAGPPPGRGPGWPVRSPPGPRPPASGRRAPRGMPRSSAPSSCRPPIALVALALPGGGRRRRGVLRQGAANVVRLLEATSLVAAHEALVRPGVDQLSIWHGLLLRTNRRGRAGPAVCAGWPGIV